MNIIEKLKQKFGKKNNNHELEKEMEHLLEDITPTLNKNISLPEKGSQKLIEDLSLTEEEIKDRDLKNTPSEDLTEQLETLKKTKEQLLHNSGDEYTDIKTR